MSFIYEEMIVIAMGGFISFFAKKCKVYPIPVKTEIFGIMIGLGIVFLVHQYYDELFYLSFFEHCRFALLGYLPMRVVCCLERK